MLHLFHPGLVHFSVAFIVVGGCAEVWGLASGRDRARDWGSTLVLAGLVSLVPTLASGYLAANTLEVPDEATALLASHERNGWILLAMLLATQFWKGWCGGRIPDRQRWTYAVVLLATVLMAVYSAWLGGRMVYGQAVGVL